jgi:hypothetical protein
LAENGDLIIDHDRHLPWPRGLMTGQPVELACPAQHVIGSTFSNLMRPR